MRQVMKALALIAISTVQVAAAAQSASTASAQEVLSKEVYVPAGTKLVVSNNSLVTTKGGRAAVGDRFYLTTVYDVVVDDAVVIPKGSAVVAEITWKTGKAVFGKSGKFDFEMRHVDVKGQLIPVSGKFRREGSGNTVATIGAVVATMALGGGLFITGKSGELKPGEQFEIVTASGVAVRVKN